MTRTYRKNSKYEKEALDGEPYRDCGDKHCDWCAEDRQNIKLREKVKYGELKDLWDNTIMREDGRVEWKCKHQVGHTIGIPHEWVKLIAEGKMDSKTAFNHGCCQDNCCKYILKDIFLESDDIESGDSYEQGGSIPPNSHPKEKK